MGLVMLGALALYFLVSISVVVVVARQARKRGRSAWRWGGLAALVMYLLVFWDYIPTVLAHRYYCEKEAGFWTYKTPDQWMKENPGVMETLVANKGWPSRHEERDGGRVKIDIDLANERFNIVVVQKDVMSFLPIIRRQEELLDLRTNEIMARYVDFSTGHSVAHTVGPPGPMKFWLHNGECGKSPGIAISSRKWMNQFRGVEK
jgi:hypothetical protein